MKKVVLLLTLTIIIGSGCAQNPTAPKITDPVVTASPESTATPTTVSTIAATHTPTTNTTQQATATATSVVTADQTVQPTFTYTPTNTPVTDVTMPPTLTFTNTPLITNTYTHTPTYTPTTPNTIPPTLTFTNTPNHTNTFTHTMTHTPTYTPTTIPPTHTPTYTFTAIPTPSIKLDVTIGPETEVWGKMKKDHLGIEYFETIYERKITFTVVSKNIPAGQRITATNCSIYFPNTVESNLVGSPVDYFDDIIPNHPHTFYIKTLVHRRWNNPWAVNDGRLSFTVNYQSYEDSYENKHIVYRINDMD